MTSAYEDSFRRIWPKFLVILLGIIELLAVIVLCLSELGNVAANFWTTNVFAGGWCGLIMLVHMFSLFVAGCCSPGLSAAFRAVVITIIAILACLVLIAFDAYFIAAPTTCLLTSSCYENSGSNTTFSYSFQKSFFSVFNSLGPFKSYSESYTKFFFQTIQICVAGLCFILCIIYLITYYICKNKSIPQQNADLKSPQNNYFRSVGKDPQSSLENNYNNKPSTSTWQPNLKPPQQPTYHTTWKTQN